MKIVIHGQFVGTCWQYQIGVDSGKQSIMDNLRVQTPGSKYCHFPKRDDYGPAYFKGLLSEHLVYKAELKHPWCWEKIPGHERNEVLDCRNYALAAFRAMNPNLDAIERKLKMLRGVEVQQTAVVQVQPKKKSTPKKGALSRYWEEW